MDCESDSRVRPDDVPKEGLVFFVVRGSCTHDSLLPLFAYFYWPASATSTVNSVKPLMLIEELAIPHTVYVVGSPSREEWFGSVNPCKMVPALEDTVVDSDGQSRRLSIWESTSCLTFLADKYDEEGLFSGRDMWERTQVGNWLTLHTASLG